MRRLVILALIWGWSFLLIKVAVAGMTPTAVAGARVALGAGVMLMVLRLRGIPLPRDAALWRHFAVMGLTHSALPFTLLAWGEERITSALTSVLNASTPLFAALLTALVLGERLRRPQMVGLGLGFVGVSIAAGIGAGDLTGSSGLGVLAALVAAASYGLGFAYARRNLSGVAPLVAATGQMVTGAIIVGPVGIVTTWQHGIDLEARRVLAIGLLGIVGTGLANVLNYRSIAEIGPTRASVVTQLVPVVAVTVGVLFLHEPFHFRLVLGGALTVFGIGLLHERFRRFRTVPAQA